MSVWFKDVTFAVAIKAIVPIGKYVVADDDEDDNTCTILLVLYC